MASDIDQNKLKVAIDWINKLANGMNPIDGKVLPDSDIVNNVHISRCLFYVSSLLEGVGKKKGSQQRQYELEFQLTPLRRLRQRSILPRGQELLCSSRRSIR